jgi:outer membrane protein assembly factor BamB
VIRRSSRRALVVASVCTVAFALLAPPARADWPQFHANAVRTGVSTGPGIPAARLDRLEIKWSRTTRPTTEGVNSSAAVVGGVVYVGSDDGRLYALGAKAGAVLWSRQTGGPVRSSPAVAGGTVFVGSSSGYLYAFGAATGAVRWRRDLGGAVTAPPLVASGQVIVGSRGGDVYAFDAATGARNWRHHTWAVWDAAAAANGLVYVTSDRQRVFALHATTGSVAWTADIRGRGRGVPAVAGGRVFVGTDRGRVYAFDAADGRELWRTNALVHGATGVVRMAPAVADGRVYVTAGETLASGKMTGHAVALGVADGRIVWRATLADYSTSSPAYADGVLFLGSFDHRLYAFDAQNGDELWNSGWKFEGGFFSRGISTSPAISDGRLFVGVRDGRIYSIGLPRG